MSIRESLSDKYYHKWLPKNNIYNKTKNDITNELLINMYNEYIDKLHEFMEEIEILEKEITKENFSPNFRQIGGYQRCVLNYPDTGWDKKYHQYIQAYKELMVDFLHYRGISYDEMSIKEISILKEMASFLIEKARENIGKLN